jgi:hypothetical protein
VILKALAPQRSPGERRVEPESLGAAHEAGWVGFPCVFVLSTGRAGTRTLAALLDRSPDIVAHHEPSPRLVRSSYEAFIEPDDQEKWRTLVLAAREELVFEAVQGSRIYAETSNRMTYFAEALAAVFPDSKFVHLHRHPFEFVASGMRRGYYGAHDWDYARIEPRPCDPIYERWPSMSRLERVAWHWAAVNAEARSFLAGLAPGRGLEMRSEDLFTGSGLEELFDFLCAPRPSGRDVRRVLRRRLNRGQGSLDFPAVGRWTHRERLAVVDQLGDVAAELGYQIDAAKLRGGRT